MQYYTALIAPIFRSDVRNCTKFNVYDEPDILWEYVKFCGISSMGGYKINEFICTFNDSTTIDL